MTRGDIWMLDLGMAAKPRPCLILSVPFRDNEKGRRHLDVNEPYLIMQGCLKRTPQGRVAMPLTYKKLGITAPKREGELFG